jgi:transposase
VYAKSCCCCHRVDRSGARAAPGVGRRPSSAQALAQRSRIVLLAAEGLKNTGVAQRLGISQKMATKWRERCATDRLNGGLLDEPRPGQPRTVSDEHVEDVITKTLQTTPKHATHWSTRSMAAEGGLSQSAVHRIWKPSDCSRTARTRGSCRRTRSSWPRSAMSSGCISTRPERAVVLCVDEKSQIQALDQTALPTHPGPGARVRPRQRLSRGLPSARWSTTHRAR